VDIVGTASDGSARSTAYTISDVFGADATAIAREGICTGARLTVSILAP